MKKLLCVTILILLPLRAADAPATPPVSPAREVEQLRLLANTLRQQRDVNAQAAQDAQAQLALAQAEIEALKKQLAAQASAQAASAKPEETK